MEQETLFNILTGHYGEILETHAMWQCIASLGIKPFKDGNQWCYLYGDNIQEGICGFGSTIYEAAWDFYSNIKTEEARQEQPEVFDTMAFQKGVQEGRRLEREEMPKWRNYGPNIIKDPFVTDLGSLVVGEKCIRIYELYNLPGFKND